MGWGPDGNLDTRLTILRISPGFSVEFRPQFHGDWEMCSMLYADDGFGSQTENLLFKRSNNSPHHCRDYYTGQEVETASATPVTLFNPFQTMLKFHMGCFYKEGHSDPTKNWIACGVRPSAGRHQVHRDMYSGGFYAYAKMYMQIEVIRTPRQAIMVPQP